jgi:hypothetical protein
MFIWRGGIRREWHRHTLCQSQVGPGAGAHRKQQAARGRAHQDVILRYEPKHILPAVVHQIIRKYLNLSRTVIQERLF